MKCPFCKQEANQEANQEDIDIFLDDIFENEFVIKYECKNCPDGNQERQIKLYLEREQ